MARASSQLHISPLWIDQNAPALFLISPQGEQVPHQFVSPCKKAFCLLLLLLHTVFLQTCRQVCSWVLCFDLFLSIFSEIIEGSFLQFIVCLICFCNDIYGCSSALICLVSILSVSNEIARALFMHFLDLGHRCFCVSGMGFLISHGPIFHTIVLCLHLNVVCVFSFAVS